MRTQAPRDRSHGCVARDNAFSAPEPAWSFLANPSPGTRPPCELRGAPRPTRQLPAEAAENWCRPVWRFGRRDAGLVFEGVDLAVECFEPSGGGGVLK